MDVDVADSEKSAIAIADSYHSGLDVTSSAISKDWDDKEEKKLKLKYVPGTGFLYAVTDAQQSRHDPFANPWSRLLCSPNRQREHQRCPHINHHRGSQHHHKPNQRRHSIAVGRHSHQ